MSTPEKNGAGSRRRTAGVALLVLAVIAAVIGVLLSLNRTQQATAPEPSAPTQTPGIPSPLPSTIPFPPVATTPVEPPEVSQAPPPAASDADEAAPDNDKGFSRGQVRVYNNSTIRGLAARAADDLSAAGWVVVEVGNYPNGIIPTTTVYYRNADQRAGAEAIAAEFGMRVEPRFPGLSDATPEIVVIVTNDYGR
jgi:LytR cell envelope-related transcriptional attenuator